MSRRRFVTMKRVDVDSVYADQEITVRADMVCMVAPSWKADRAVIHFIGDGEAEGVTVRGTVADIVALLEAAS